MEIQVIQAINPTVICNMPCLSFKFLTELVAMHSGITFSMEDALYIKLAETKYLGIRSFLIKLPTIWDSLHVGRET